MKRNHRTGLRTLAAALCLTLAIGSALAQQQQAQRQRGNRRGARAAAEAKEGFVPLFNGKDLTGWEGDPAIWSVKDGAIVGVAKMIKVNNFLSTKKEYGDFILRAQIRLVDNKGNTGIQFRSTKVPDSPRMKGFQADYANNPKYCGMLYDEMRRGILLQPTPEKTTQAANKPGQWNRLEIKAEGNKITLALNGVTTVEYTEKDPAIPAKGLIGLQAHAGFNMEVQFRNIRIKELKH